MLHISGELLVGFSRKETVSYQSCIPSVVFHLFDFTREYTLLENPTLLGVMSFQVALTFGGKI